MPKKTTKKSGAKKIFVLDTNVLLHDPQCLFKFEENTLAIPVEVLEELDRKKSAPGELGFAARQVHRDLRRLFDEEMLNKKPDLEGTSSSMLTRDLPSGGKLVVVINDYYMTGETLSEGMKRLHATLVDFDKMDNRILASVVFLNDVNPDSRVILVTKDANMALKGIALGLEVQDYMNDKVNTTHLGGCQTVKVDDEATNALSKSMVSISLPKTPAISLSMNTSTLLAAAVSSASRLATVETASSKH